MLLWISAPAMGRRRECFIENFYLLVNSGVEEPSKVEMGVVFIPSGLCAFRSRSDVCV